MSSKKVLILMGSASDHPVVSNTASVLDEFSIEYEMHVSSAHRTPKKTLGLVQGAEKRGIGVIICAAGKAAHLAGVTAAHTLLPVLGIPMETKLAGGLDSLLSTVQMPSGTPVATFGTGRSGAVNAGLFAVQLLAGQNSELLGKLSEYRRRMVAEVEEKDKEIQGI